MTLKFRAFALCGLEGLKIRKFSLKKKNCIVFTLFLLYLKVRILGSFVDDFLGPILVFRHFRGLKIILNLKISSVEN